MQHISFRRRSGVTFLRPLFLTRSRHCTDKLTFDAAEDLAQVRTVLFKAGGGRSGGGPSDPRMQAPPVIGSITT